MTLFFYLIGLTLFAIGRGLIPFSLVKKATALMESEMKAATLWQFPFSAAWEVLLFNCFTASAVREILGLSQSTKTYSLTFIHPFMGLPSSKGK